MKTIVPLVVFCLLVLLQFAPPDYIKTLASLLGMLIFVLLLIITIVYILLRIREEFKA